MSKIRYALVTLLTAMLIIFVCSGATFAARAETLPQDLQRAETSEETEDGKTDGRGLEELTEQFKDYLKERYGSDYENYYNAIIEQWGSVEGYLLSFGDKLNDEQRSAWDKFVGWLSDYASVWAPALAVVIVILAAIFGKRTLNKALKKTVDAKLSPVIKELNLQSSATASIIRAQRALLGNSEKFSGTVEELTEAEKELKNE